MKIYVHDDRPGQPLRLTPELWADCFRHVEPFDENLSVTFGETAQELSAALPDVELLVCTNLLPRALPGPAPRLRYIFCTFAGIDALMPFDWLPVGVELLNNSGVHEAKAGEYAIMSMLMLANNIPAYSTSQHHQKWERRPGSMVAKKRLTIIGLGALGSGAARWANCLGMHVTGIRNRVKPHAHCHDVRSLDQLEEVLANSDFLLLACPLTSETRNILDRRRLAALPRGAFVVNIGRGGLVDQDALCDALDYGALGGAVLDVFSPEPVPIGHRLWTTPNLLMTPHVSCDDSESYLTQSLSVLEVNLRAIIAGLKLPNQVDKVLGY